MGMWLLLNASVDSTPTCVARWTSSPWVRSASSARWSTTRPATRGTNLFLNHYRTHAKILRSDRGGEYINDVLEDYCAGNGIVMEFTVPHTPEQNGVAERMNRKILDKGRTIMKDMDAPDFLWADAFATVVYAINRTINSRNRSVSPFEAFFGKRPDISHMRVWFSNMFVHRPKDLGARKLGARGLQESFCRQGPHF